MADAIVRAQQRMQSYTDGLRNLRAELDAVMAKMAQFDKAQQDSAEYKGLAHKRMALERVLGTPPPSAVPGMGAGEAAPAPGPTAAPAPGPTAAPAPEPTAAPAPGPAPGQPWDRQRDLPPSIRKLLLASGKTPDEIAAMDPAAAREEALRQQDAQLTERQQRKAATVLGYTGDDPIAAGLRELGGGKAADVLGRTRIRLDSDMRAEWKQSAEQLKSYQREIAELEKRFRALTAAEQDTRAIEIDLQERRGQRAETIEKRKELRKEFAEAGIDLPEQEVVAAVRSGGAQQGRAALLRIASMTSGMIGSGGMALPAIAGGMVGGGIERGAAYLEGDRGDRGPGILGTAGGVLGILAGAVVSKAISYGMDAYRTGIQAQGENLPIGLASGIESNALMDDQIRLSSKYKLSASSIRRSQGAWARGTGSTDLPETMLGLSRLTGVSSDDLTRDTLRSSMLSGRRDDSDAMLRMLQVYGKSAQGRENNLLFPAFAQQALQATQDVRTPLGAANSDIVGLQLAGLSQTLNIPGFEKGSVAQLGAVGQVLGGYNRLAGGTLGSDAFSSFKLMGLQGLGPDVYEKIRKKTGQEYDPNKIEDLQRLMFNAPSLAAQGVPEVQAAMMQSMRRYTTPGQRQMEWSRMFDPNVANLLEKQGPQIMEAVGKAQGGGDWKTGDAEFDAAVTAVLKRSDVNSQWNMEGRVELQQLQAFREIVQPWGDTIVEGMRNLNDTLRTELRAFFNSPEQGPDSLTSVGNTFGTDVSERMRMIQ